MKTLIYGLVDPRTGQLRYIGKSCSGFERPRRHGSVSALAKDETYKGRWIKELHGEGLSYEIVLIQEVDREILETAEIHWIAYFRAMGCPLTNLTNGGDGCTGTKRSSATKEKIAESNRRRVISPETRAKMSAAKRGKVPRNLAGVHAGLRGKKQSVELIKKRSAARMQVIVDQNGVIYKSLDEAAKKLGIHPSTVSKVVNGLRRQAHGFKFKRIDHG